MATSIPVIDFAAYSLDRDEPDPTTFQKLIDEVHEALTIVGFMYLKNFGIPQQTIHDAFAISREYFALPHDVKMRCLRPRDTCHGYLQNEREGLASDRPGDLKECFNYNPKGAILQPQDQIWPDDVLPAFREKFEELFKMCVRIHNRILEVIGKGLELPDPMYLTKCHDLMGTTKNTTTLRTLYYPPLSEMTIHNKQVRCGEHSDYGAITMLFQDEQGGLETKTLEGRWIPATPVEGTMVVNLGDLLQRWTADKLIASKHRILLPPKGQPQWRNFRQSIAFFGHPDDDTLIECVDGSQKYPPITSLAYLNQRIADTYY